MPTAERMTIDINQAERRILALLPEARALGNNAINTKGLFLVFHSLVLDNAYLAQVGYAFRLYVALNSQTRDRRLAYQPLSSALSRLLSDWQKNQAVELGPIRPAASRGLLIYEAHLVYRDKHKEV